MFDANARHIATKEVFFVTAISVDDNNMFISKLLHKGQVYACSKIEGDTDNYKMRVFLNKTLRDYITFEVREDDEFDFENFFVFCGRFDGSGFIHSNEKEKALKFLGGQWK